MQQAGGISYSSQIVFFQFLHYTCFSSAICPLQVPATGLFDVRQNTARKQCKIIVIFVPIAYRREQKIF